MTDEERVDRARASLAQAVTHKDKRDVSEEVCSCVANLIASNAKFEALDTNQHEIRGIIGQGIVAELREVLARWSPVPRPNQPSPHVQIQELVKRAANAFALVEVKMDGETASLLAEQDPFHAAYAAPGAIERGRAECAELLRGLDVDALFAEREPPPENSGVVAKPEQEYPVLEVGEDEVDAAWLTVIDDPFPRPRMTSIPPPLPPHAGIGESEAERRFFGRTG